MEGRQMRFRQQARPFETAAAELDSAGAALPGHRLLPLVIVCGIGGIAAWVFYVWALIRNPGQDWMVFYTAARAYLDGNLPIIFDGQQLTAALNQRFAGWLELSLNLHPWVYPPSFLLLFLPFGLLPPVASLVIFEIAGLVAALAAVWRYGAPGRGRAMLTASLFLCPAVPFNVMTGQNAFLSAALLVGGFRLLNTAPLLAGGLLGILTYKPQMWLMVPIALVAARQWRALASASLTALLIALLSLAFLGGEIWRQWIELMSGGDAQFQAWIAAGRINGMSVFACMRLLGAPQIVANFCQVAAVAIAGGCVYWIFRRSGASPLAVAALLTATMLAAPHASTSDAVLLGLAASLFLTAVPGERFRSSWAVLAAAVWLCPLFNPPSLFRVGLLTPILLLVFLACIITALREKRRSATMRALTPA
jgi:hypothetical protein